MAKEKVYSDVVEGEIGSGAEGAEEVQLKCEKA